MTILLISLFLFFLIFLLTSLKIRIEYRLEDNGLISVTEIDTWFVIAGLPIRVSLFRNPLLAFFRDFFRGLDDFFRKMWPGDKKEDIEKGFGAAKKALGRLKDYLAFFFDRELLNILSNNLQIKCHHLCWITEQGLADPAYTAIFYGLIWSVKGMLLRILDELVYFEEEIKVEVIPDFHSLKFSTSFCGIFSLRLGNIIYTISKVFLHRILSSLKDRIYNRSEII